VRNKTTKLNELKVIELPSNLAIHPCIDVLYSRFSAISDKLKIDELSIKEGEEINVSIELLKLLKQVTEKIQNQYGDKDHDFYELGNHKSSFAKEVNKELTDGLMSILNG